ncbi:DUF565 domain-containing protein [Allocoleopsis sp.]|uniref:DUF565 domain-containing protein n=1 Tax=Allocoleopsis sp. TaxID=3088169 RepID=UPI0032C22BDB
MQNTRLNNLINGVLAGFGRWFANPWRHLSLVLISLLLGTFLGSAIPATAGQTARLDVVGAGVLIIFTEIISWFVYGRNRQRGQSTEGSRGRSLLAEVLNALKIGLTYSMFIEAFKLGS